MERSSKSDEKHKVLEHISCRIYLIYFYNTIDSTYKTGFFLISVIIIFPQMLESRFDYLDLTYFKKP